MGILRYGGAGEPFGGSRALAGWHAPCKLTHDKEKSVSNSPAKGTALITGAFRGIGAVYADRLAKRGYDLILVARSEKRLRDLAARLASETGRSVTPLVADLNDKPDLAKVETTLRDDQTITMLLTMLASALSRRC